MQNKILITGGTGRLAKELKNHLDGEYVGIENWDFVYPDEIPNGEYDLILHMGAYTDVAKAQKEQQKCMMANVMGTFNMVQKYKDTPFVYISTEWAHKPLGVYALSKQLGEEIVKTHPKHLILRTLFKPTPWPFEFAYEDQMTQGDYVDVIAKLLSDIVKGWDKVSCETRFLGTGRKTIYNLAMRTKPEVKPNTVDEYNLKVGGIVPKDYID